MSEHIDIIIYGQNPIFRILRGILLVVESLRHYQFRIWVDTPAGFDVGEQLITALRLNEAGIQHRLPDCSIVVLGAYHFVQFEGTRIRSDRLNRLADLACSFGSSGQKGFLAFINSGLEIPNDLFLKCLRISGWQDSSIGVLGIKCIYPDGAVCHVGSTLFADSGRITLARRPAWDIASLPGYPIGASVSCLHFLLTKHEVFERVGGFSNKYQQYLFDTEYCIKCLLIDVQSIIHDDVTAIFYGNSGRTYNGRRIVTERSEWQKVFFPFLLKRLAKLYAKKII
ncbi:hypothetical protein SAMN05216327_12014 [Dyadobacter sp. SG02]|uniref:hypothetical protein n=1 Tax=Dyadobacter sp. SG02 TaxID=1855291 RepID=UPI0008B5236A|nr:hypothetical protein [Dyadobacter sp. SG02]SEJ78920.1 hypothetical protein SAMN05216327_12014 [Dyadobacter sp. SG02]